MTSPAERSLLVVGGGPAGLAAAVAAAGAGVRVTLVDGAPRLGGQYWRHGPGGVTVDPDLHHDVAVFTDLLARVAELTAAGRLVHLPQHQVWAVAVDDDRCTVHAIDRRDDAGITLTAGNLVLAVGAYDRQVPFPGWTLPGVMTVGGAQALLKGSGVAVGPRVLVAGTGPFLLPVATGLAVRGSTVVGVHEAHHAAGWLRHLPVVAAQRGKVAEAAGYAAVLARHRIPLHQRSVVIAAHGTDRVTAVGVASLDRSGAVRPRTVRRIPVDVVAVGYGFTAQSELPLQAGCTVRTTADGTLAVTTDDRQNTGHPRVFAAGETTGVGGAQLAVAEGTVAGLAAAGLAPPAAVTVTRSRLRRFAAALHAVYPVPAGWPDHLRADTVVCRCEEVTVADIDAAIDLGARDTRTVKLMSRSGMGWCQGRECAYATACLTALRTGRPPDLRSGADRPVATPIPLGVVAGLDPEPGLRPDPGLHPGQGESP